MTNLKKNHKIGNSPSLSSFIRNELPEFCFQTVEEIRSFIDEAYVDEDPDWNESLIDVILYKEYRKGNLERKIYQQKTYRTHQRLYAYRRRTDPRYERISSQLSNHRVT